MDYIPVIAPSAGIRQTDVWIHRSGAQVVVGWIV